MSTLQKILAHIGFDERPQQTHLFHALALTDESGTVVQAGTGTGKSLAVLAAAYDKFQETGNPALVVTPTNVLMDQYISIDAPRVEDALGVDIQSLKGRARYLCESAAGFLPMSSAPEWVKHERDEMRKLLYGGGTPVEPQNTSWFGCPGGDDCDPDLMCHYRAQKERAQAADIIITNSHLLIIDSQFKRMAQVTGGDEGPRIFPELSAVFVDEAHVLEDSLRSFATRSIPAGACGDNLLGYWIDARARGLKEATAISGDAELAAALREMAHIELPRRASKALKQAVESAAYILNRAQNKAYSSGAAVLYIEPKFPGSKQENKLVSTQIDMASAAAGLLTPQPFALVSATIPKSLTKSLGIPDATFIDVGHPFDYRRQAKLGVSRFSGAYQAVQNDSTNMVGRASEIYDEVMRNEGGALLLFPSYRDLDFVYRQIAGPMHLKGLKVLKQERDSNKALLGAQFRANGNAVLFGTESFATGFDVPGDALRLVVIWKLPYPGLDPLTRAISARNYSKYEDMMLTKVAQAAGRLIRTSEDVGEIWIADARARGKILGTGDPMLRHFDEFQIVAAEEPVDIVEMN